MVFRPVTLLLLLALLIFGCAREARAMTCEELFQNGSAVPANGTISNTQLIMKYGDSIERIRRRLFFPQHTKHTPNAKDGRLLAGLIDVESKKDPSLFWRLFYVVLQSRHTPTTPDFQEAFLQEMFLRSHELIQPTANRPKYYALFERLLSEGFRPARENSHGQSHEVLNYYEKLFWVPAIGNLRPETTLTTFWKKKAAARFPTDEAALSEGRAVADNIVKHSTNTREYFRLYFIVFTQFRVHRPEAFFEGLLSARFTAEFYKLDQRTQNLVRQGVEVAALRNKASLSIPRDPLLLEKAEATGADLVRTILAAPRNEVSKLIRAIQRESKQDPHAFAELLIVAMTEQKFHPSTLQAFANGIFDISQQIDFSSQDQIRIRDTLAKTAAHVKIDHERLWGTTDTNRGAEAKLRQHLTQLRWAWAKRKHLPASRTMEDRAADIHNFILKEIGNDVRSYGSSQLYVYARLLHIVLTENPDTNTQNIELGIFKRRFDKVYHRLDQNQRIVFGDASEIKTETRAANEVDIIELEPQDIKTTPEAVVELALSHGSSIASFIRDIQKQQGRTQNAQSLANLGQSLALFLERLAGGEPQNIFPLVAETIKASSRPLHFEVRTAFRLEMMNVMKRVNMPLTQQEFISRLLRSSQEEAREILFDFENDASEAR